MRALFVLVVMCLVSAGRPTPNLWVKGGDAHDGSKLDEVKSRIDVVTSRRSANELAAPCAPVDAILTSPLTIPPPVRFVCADTRAFPDRSPIVVVVSRSARGPPVG